MSEDAPNPPGKKRSPLLVGCLVVAGLVIGIPAACTAVLALTGDGEKHFDVDTGTADANGFEWPLTVDEGRIYCPGAGRLVFESDGTRYALNGLAMGTHEYADIDPIWKDNPEIGGTKLDIGGLIEHGNRACGY